MSLFKVLRRFFRNSAEASKKYLHIRVMLPLYQKLLVLRLRHKERINVVFIASTLPMWRYQKICSLLGGYSHFNVSIVILPFGVYSKEQQNEDVETLKAYFDSCGMKYYVGGEAFDIRKELCPDILFYPQPYVGNYVAHNDYCWLRDRLLCYSPYAFWTAIGEWSYNEPLHNYAWKLFYSTELHRKEAIKYAYNHGRNIEVVGYSNADSFLEQPHRDVWKLQEVRKKRVVWAPHFSIFPDGLMVQSSFLSIAEFMLELAERYSDRIQFVFKPHPRLITELYKHEDWGITRTTDYYNEWATRSNTQLESGEFVDLFMTSDAMIHDCGSFSVEYHYSGNPVMFVAEDFERIVSEKGELGQLAMRLHYVGRCQEDIVGFIEQVVLEGNDPMRCGRKDFYNRYLLPPNGKSVAENVVDVLLKAFA